MANEAPFIVKVDPTGLVARYGGVGFHATAAAPRWPSRAAALLGHFQMMERDVDYGVLAVVRVLEALQASQPTVGGPLGLFRLLPDGRSGSRTTRSTRSTSGSGAARTRLDVRLGD